MVLSLPLFALETQPMNPTLNRFVRETERQFRGRMVTPKQLAAKPLTRDEYLDTAVISGYSLSDILHGRVTEANLDPAIIRAFQLQYPNAGGFVDFIKSHRD